jgi:hypothetical protein
VSAYRLNDPRQGVIGPISLEAVRDLMKAGVIQDDVQVSKDNGPFMPVQSFAELKGPMSREGSPKPTYAGDLGKNTFFRVFYRFHLARLTGLLTVKLEARQKEVFLEDGQPIFVASNIPEERIGEYMVRREVITRHDLDVALASMRTDGNRLGQTLIRLGLIEPPDFYAQLLAQQVDRLVDLCTWETGRYQFFQGARYDGEKYKLKLVVSDLVLRAARSMDEATLARRLLMSMDLRPRRVAHAELDRGVFPFSPMEARVLDSVDGQRTVAEIVRTAGADETRRRAALMILYLLLEVDAVAVS